MSRWEIFVEALSEGIEKRLMEKLFMEGSNMELIIIINFAVLLLLSVYLIYRIIILCKKEKDKGEKHEKILEHINVITTICVAIIANVLVFNAQKYQENMDEHNKLTEKLTYSYTEPGERVIEEIEKENASESYLSVPISIDVRTGEIYKYAIIDFRDGEIKDILTDNVAEVGMGKHENIERYLTLRLKKENEPQETHNLVYYVMVEGMDGSKNLDMIQFTITKDYDIMSWNFFYGTSLMGFDILSDDYKARYSDYKMLYDIIMKTDIE